jgi:hypothetical protein
MASSTRSRADHLAWAKERALAYAAAGDVAGALASIASDFNKHEELRSHPGLTAGMKAHLGGLISTADDVRGLLTNLQ